MTFLVHPTQLQLEILPAVQVESWQQAQVGTTAQAIWQIYLNQICLQTLLPWLQTTYRAAATGWNSNSSTWELVTGTAITMGTQRLIVIPEKTIDTDELRVPQEWIDIPSWAGDYYLAAQVDPDANTIRIWGCTTHAQVQAGVYDAADRTYAVEAQSLIQDLSVLWVAQQLAAHAPTQGIITPLSPLTATQAENLVQRLGDRAIAQPRLAIPFALWGALLLQDQLRQQLAQRRWGSACTDLSSWWHQQFSASWQALTDLLSPADLAVSWRQGPSTIAEVCRAKEMVLLEQPVLLLIGLTPEADGRVSVRVQLRPRDRDCCLLPDLTLEMCDSAGAIVQTVSARSADNLVQLRRFRCVAGSQFRLRVVIADVAIVEDFLV